MTKSSGIASIVIDGKNLALRQGTGVATYAKSLCANLKQLNKRVEILYGEPIEVSSNPNEAAVNFFDTSSPRQRLPWLVRSTARVARQCTQPFRTIVPRELPFASSSISAQQLARLPAADRFWNARDVFDIPGFAVERGYFQKVRNVMGADSAHWTYPVPVRLDDAFNIYTLHDLVPLKLPHTTLDNKRRYYAMIKKIVETASLITTVSEQSKQDIHALFSVPDARVVNTYQDVDLDAAMLKQSQDEVAEALSGVLGLEFGKYFLFYGAIEPKKNVGRLIEAHLGSSLDLPLVLVGKDGWLVDGELQLYSQHLQRRIGPQRVIRLPYVSREQLINLIRGACAVTFPSLYEGFGLPLVEAMVCGTPVLTSNIGAMKEVAGEAALFVDPYDVSSIRDGLRRMAYNRPLQDELRLAGGERALHFSSERYRKRLLAAYASATC